MEYTESYIVNRLIDTEINQGKNGMKVYYFSGSDVDIFYYQVSKVIIQFKKMIVNEVPIKLTLFSHCINKEDFKLKQSILDEIISIEKFGLPVALVAQQPLSGSVCLEVYTLDLKEKPEITKGVNYQIIRTSGIELLFSSINSCEYNSISENSESCFKDLISILKHTNFNYSDIIRQWNYIDNILDSNSTSNKVSQNYQNFNDIRSEYYNLNSFKDGYPVATGIGTTTGGCTVEIIAIKGKTDQIIPIKNTRQIDAQSYSDEVLIGEGLKEKENKTTPKFERAKTIQCPITNTLMVSGTASIIGEETVFEYDIVGQTKTTIDNIKLLVEEAKTKTYQDNIKLINYRVYIKNKKDYVAVKNLCNKSLGISPSIYVQADVCRDNLLVEIECNYSFTKNSF